MQQTFLKFVRLSNGQPQKDNLSWVYFVWFDVNVPVNSYGHVDMVSSPNHTFFPGKLDKAVNQYFVHILSLVTLHQWKEENHG